MACQRDTGSIVLLARCSAICNLLCTLRSLSVSTLASRKEIEARLRVARVLGSADDRKEARIRLGLTLAQLGELCGLSVAQIRLRESDKWAMKRSSLDGEAEWRYVQTVAVLRNLEHLLTDPLGVDE
jgi:hypothetical protein